MSNYSKADRGAQWFANRWPGTKITPNCGVIHTTEGASWPSYNGGAYAPGYTANPDIKNRRVLWRAHFPDEMNSRALVNAAGGVETNTANAIQVELVGTCDDKHAVEWPGVGKAGVDYIYWPDAPDWCLQAVADFLTDMHERHGIPLDGPDVWLRYGKDGRRPGVWPASYGASPARLTFKQWREFKGWCGHQHVPENSHGDPGALDFARIVALAKGSAPRDGGTQDVEFEVPKPKPEPTYWTPTAKGYTTADVQRIVGVVVDNLYGPATMAAVRELQKRLGVTADGYFGPATAAAYEASKRKPKKGKRAPDFPLPRGHWFGVESDDPRNHSGYWRKDRAGIKRWQRQMKRRGWSISVDGRFGPQSEGVAESFQREKGLSVDGLVGAITWAASWTEPVT